VDSFVIYSGAEGSALEDQITREGRPYDLTGASVKLKVRLADSEDLKVDEDAVVLEDEKGIVRYEWADVDIDTVGEYFGWWEITNPDSSVTDTSEFSIIVAQHAPGLRTRTGAIYKVARSLIPITWDALANSNSYGDELLQQKVELIKAKTLATTVLAEDEIDLDIRVIDYLAKLVVLSVIPAGVDYWGSQRISVSATGTNENATFINRVEMLWQLYEKFLVQVAADRDEIEELLGNQTLRSATGIPAISDGAEEGFVTPNPTVHFREYAFDRSESLPPRVVEGSFWR
jgi:hypothetical protein